MKKILDKIKDDYTNRVETYKSFCNLLDERISDNKMDYFKHEEQLMKKYHFIKKGCWYVHESQL